MRCIIARGDLSSLSLRGNVSGSWFMAHGPWPMTMGFESKLKAMFYWQNTSTAWCGTYDASLLGIDFV